MISEVEKIADKIRSMEIRGAGEIARASASALKALATESEAEDKEVFIDELKEAKKILLNTRPTAVSLANAIRFVIGDLNDISEDQNIEDLRKQIISRSEDFIEKSEKATERIGEIGSRRISDGDTIMTHCNSSNALAVIKRAHDQGKDIRVIANEARPRQQGLISVKELSEYGISTTLIVDSAARSFMKEVDKLIVGADSIAANGAVINKIGTSQIALAAHEARVPTFVAAESYKFHPSTCILY